MATTSSKTKPHRLYALILGLMILGWTFCCYLVYRSSLLVGDYGDTFDLCKSLFRTSCDNALSTKISWHLGFPLAGIGMAYFGLLGVLVFIRKPWMDRTITFLTAFGLGASIILSYIIIRGQLHCPLCILIHLINLTVFICMLQKSRTLQSIGEKSSGRFWSFRPKILVLLFIMIFSGGFTEVKLLKSAFDTQPPVHLEEIADAFQHTKAYTFPDSTLAPRIGSGAAPVQLVVFSSFQCPACKDFASSLKNLEKKYGGKIGITFRNFPLSSNCNSKLAQNMHPY